MIAFLSGTLAGSSLTEAYVDVGGVGFAVQMSGTSLSKLPEKGESVMVLTYLQASENGIALFGFLTEEERAMFTRLIGVSGVGPKAALAALSTFSPHDLADAISSQDVSRIQRIPGVGKKTASRMIVELKGSLDAEVGNLFGGDDGNAVLDRRKNGAVEALLQMGFTTAEIDVALAGAPEGATEESLIRYALKRIGGV